ncbi:CKLF-like MARVEL transmembrane domain-containing protein 6 [Xenopus tropicalis]|uniref:CKLF-like MARVEL transmembrane domain-containing protein 6 n=2 Tax=Xenopus tropicalis TaxID=8364 RepID=Q28D06_XENTR|nr:CKLF-like MARVEL transmembrane domain-containing protein 6 [Xenopus tropicalis]CAJ83603.1 chemokine-like factor superfamily 6 [Xenopus tropicalis]|eukprot:NP_001034830.1 CKLF-like MARVEL transmembrane domain-containing protein 6 [Xenopus tropicalis]
MTDGAVYATTTEPSNPGKKSFCSVTELGKVRFPLKVAQLLFSFIGFVCEEIIDQCENCGGLYFFEFVSCSAFLLALLLIIVYCTPLRQKVNPNSLKSIDFWISSITGLLFLIASIVFAATMDDISLAKVSVAFGFLASVAFIIEAIIMYMNGDSPFTKKANVNGTNRIPEVQPLNNPIQAQEPGSEQA